MIVCFSIDVTKHRQQRVKPSPKFQGKLYSKQLPCSHTEAAVLRPQLHRPGPRASLLGFPCREHCDKEKVALEPDDWVGNCVLSSTSWEAQASETSVSPSVRGMRPSSFAGYCPN